MIISILYHPTMSRVNRLLINRVDDCVDEMLEGVVMQNPGQRLLKGHRVVVREDFGALVNAEKVSLICGGGSGHEPFAAGFVGQGMLTAAVAGSVFTSPPVNDILAAIKAVSSPAGTLLIVANYTGDRLNFGIALERAKRFGLNVEMVVVGEDCALESEDKTAGKRGLVGIVAIMKIAGALSENKKTLDYIVKVTTAVAARMGTIGVSLTGCSIPGRGSSFVLDPSEMELGLGVHGEAGVKRMKILSADETVEVMINHMTGDNTSSFSLESGEKVSLIMNNLGGLSILEMHILTRKAILYLQGKGILVERVYSGHFMTSLDMAGFNLNVLKLDDEIVSCLDAATTAPAWPALNESVVSGYQRSTLDFLDVVDKKQLISDVEVSVSAGKESFDNTAVVTVIEQVCTSLMRNEQYLNELDTTAGDGDCGTTLKHGATAVLSLLGEWKSLSLSEILLNIAKATEDSMGGASGALYSLFFTAGSMHAKELSVSSWAACLKAGIDAISKYGGAAPGDRTMLDALVAAHGALMKSINEKCSDIEAAKNAAKFAEIAANATTNMQAKAGRASYVASKLLTRPDPGAVGVSIWLKAISDYCIKHL